MTRFYVPREARIRETVSALAVALGVGGLSFYLVRMFLAREGLETEAPTPVESEPGRRISTKGQGAR